MRHSVFFGLVAALALPAPAFALREIITGNQPIGPEHGYDKEVLHALNVPERVILSEGGLDGTLEVYFRGGPAALNEAFRRFAAIPAAEREIILLPGPTKPFAFGKESFPYDWVLHVPGTRGPGGARPPTRGRVTLTVYVPNPSPPAPADPKAVRQWIADLGHDDFKTRDRAAGELAAVGRPAAALLREALQGKPTPEARDRIEKLLAGMSGEVRPDVLDLPAGVAVVSIDDLLDRARKRLADKDPIVRGHAAWSLGEHPAAAAEVLPDLEKVLTTETDANPLCGAAGAACQLGAAARPLLPALRKAAASKNQSVADMSRSAIDRIEKEKADPVPEAEAKRRATIRKEIKAFLAGRAASGGK